MKESTLYCPACGHYPLQQSEHYAHGFHCTVCLEHVTLQWGYQEPCVELTDELPAIVHIVTGGAR